MFIEALKEVVVDTLKLLPFLFITYLIMEYIEHKTENKAMKLMQDSGKVGPLIGAAVGAVPQCGFSAMSASLYSGGMITLGSLIAVFLSTSDEMLPILISNTMPVGTIAKSLIFKIIAGVVTGIIIDLAVRKIRGTNSTGKRIHDLCEREHCGCDNEDGHSHGIIRPALKHTFNIIWFIFVISLIAALVLEYSDADSIAAFLVHNPVASIFISGLIGLIPNCASSVMLTELYIKGMLSPAGFMTGLLVGAGVGVLVLFRTNRNMKENLGILGLLYVSGIIWGFIINAIRLVF